ncbi:CZB domain-containing protein [Celeribacter naphthalenivorans]|uniref:CZB domain-containing protein n=1 Tax=Celeribacter naphthalenivorans TaxID=1614694 RepID=UPI001CFC18CC|nr:CZB domain-containing protein [Celeribacter naphthalenivorans]
MTTQDIKGEAQIRDAICAHSAWRRKLADCIEKGQLEKTSDEISCNDKCDFGKWLAQLRPDAQNPAMEKFEMIAGLHTRFHREAGKIAIEVEKGDRDAARALYEAPSFRRLTNSLVLNLNDWRQDFKTFM